jgi:FAD:protein FMN transferase
MDGYHYTTLSKNIMGTEIAVMVPEGASIAPSEAADAVFEVFHEVDRWASEWRDDSALTAVNQAAGGDPVKVPPELLSLVQQGIALGERSDGAFDISWAALWGLWDFTAETPKLPAEERLKAQLALVDFRLIEVDEAASTIHLSQKGMVLGLGGIAKGYALAQAGEALRSRGLDSFSLSAGGQVLVAGRVRLKGETPRPWRVGIRDPRGGPDDFFASLEASDMSISTSGDYERFFNLDGVRYHHVLDLRTGKPARESRAASVISTDPTLADALSTVLMVMGPPGLALIEEHEGVEGIVVDKTGAIHSSSGLGDKLILHHRPRR